MSDIGALNSQLPVFRYHPDPIASGVIQASTAQCACCGMQRGFIYVGPVYGEADLHDSLCPWCIADGSAASKLGASFADDYPLRRANVPGHIIEEINLRTPAFFSWQQEEWLAHCGDACAFLGDASVADVANATEATKLDWHARYELNEEDWQHITTGYTPRGAQSFYKFQCLHCSAILLGWDCS